jgi:hypothetical protein
MYQNRCSVTSAPVLSYDLTSDKRQYVKLAVAAPPREPAKIKAFRGVGVWVRVGADFAA